MRVAFAGMGIMGRPMAANLAKAGHSVVVWNRTPGKEAEGTSAASTPAAAVADAEVLWMCVSDTAAVERVLFGEDGAAGALQPGAVVIDSSTISPSATLRFAEQLSQRGVNYIDAPVTGSKVAAETGQLIFMVGGKHEVIEPLQHLFSTIGKAVFRMGDVSKGQATKLCMNLQIALIYEGFAEAITLAKRLGVELETILPLIQASMVRSGVVDYKAPFVLKHDFTPNFPLRLMHKDLRLAQESARELRVKLPGLQTVEEVYDVASDEGYSNLDYAATLALLEKWAGIPLK